MKAVLTDERFSTRDWVYERKLDGIRCLAFKARQAGAAAIAQRPEPQRALPRDRRGARGATPSATFVVDGEVVAFDGLADELRAPAAARRARGPRSSSTSSTCCTSRGTTRPRCRCARASALLRARSRFDGPIRLTHAPQPRRRGALPRGLPQGLGGADRQARRRALHARPLARLAQVQVLGRAGARHRRLHGAARQPHRPRRAAARLLRRRPPALRGQGRAPASRRRRCATWPRGWRRCAATARRSPTRSASATRRGWSRELVAQVGFTEWTRDGRLRHPRFLGLREDKAAKEVVRE